MAKGLYVQKISSGYDKWFWNYDILNFEKYLLTPIFIPNISVKAIKNPIFILY